MEPLAARKIQFQRLGAWFVTMALLIAQSGHAIGDYSLLANCLADSAEFVFTAHGHNEREHAPFQQRQHQRNVDGLAYQADGKHCKCSSMCPFCKGYPSAYLFPIPVHFDVDVADQSETYFQSVPVYTSHLAPPLRPPPITWPV